MQIKDRIFGSGILSDERMKKELHLLGGSDGKPTLLLMKFHLLQFCKILKDERVLQSERGY
jgi:hypothetical protein